MALIIVVSGFAIYKPTQLYPLPLLFGGYQGARLIHFTMTIGLFLFFLVHVLQVIRSGWGNFRSMVTGYQIEHRQTHLRHDPADLGDPRSGIRDPRHRDRGGLVVTTERERELRARLEERADHLGRGVPAAVATIVHHGRGRHDRGRPRMAMAPEPARRRRHPPTTTQPAGTQRDAVEQPVGDPIGARVPGRPRRRRSR